MNCREFWDAMPELAGEPPSGLAREHLEQCPSCAELFENHVEIAAALGRVAAGSRVVGAPPRVEARLLAAYRAQSGLEAGPARGWWVPLLTWSAAAAATAALALLLVHGKQPSATTSPGKGGPHQRPPARMQLASLPTPDLDLMEASAETEGQFIPVPNMEELGPNDEVGIVRLEVSRSAMAELGFVVSEERASETVEAEIAIGSDGLAHAVRFVNRWSDPQE
jgi:hypothetical protein